MARSNRCAMLAALAFAASAAAPAIAQQQNPREVAQAPANLTSSGRIAPAGEPGVPVVISGTVLAPDGKTPARGVTVYAYHTDANGQYRRTLQAGEAGESEPRLRGWVKTDGNGHFEFFTIRPAPYPNRNVPAHVHLHVWGAGFPRQWFELDFEGDPLIAKQRFTDDTADYLYVMPVMVDANGALRCTVTIRLRPVSNFRR